MTSLGFLTMGNRIVGVLQKPRWTRDIRRDERTGEARVVQEVQSPTVHLFGPALPEGYCGGFESWADAPEFYIPDVVGIEVHWHADAASRVYLGLVGIAAACRTGDTVLLQDTVWFGRKEAL